MTVSVHFVIDGLMDSNYIGIQVYREGEVQQIYKKYSF
jgi:hypothetical protein